MKKRLLVTLLVTALTLTACGKDTMHNADNATMLNVSDNAISDYTVSENDVVESKPAIKPLEDPVVIEFNVPEESESADADSLPNNADNANNSDNEKEDTSNDSALSITHPEGETEGALEQEQPVVTTPEPTPEPEPEASVPVTPTPAVPAPCTHTSTSVSNYYYTIPFVGGCENTYTDSTETCNNCGVVVRTWTTHNQETHDTIILEAGYAATCTTDGKYDVTSCSCGWRGRQGGNTIPASGHTYKTWCTGELNEDFTKARYVTQCIYCNDLQSEEWK